MGRGVEQQRIRLRLPSAAPAPSPPPTRPAVRSAHLPPPCCPHSSGVHPVVRPPSYGILDWLPRPLNTNIITNAKININTTTANITHINIAIIIINTNIIINIINAIIIILEPLRANGWIVINI